MLSATYLRLLPTLTFRSTDVTKLLLSSQNTTQFYLQYFRNREIVLNEHSVEISTDGEITTFIDDNPDRNVACLALFVTSLRFSIHIPDFEEFFVLLGRAKRVISFVADRGHGGSYAAAQEAANFLANQSLPGLKTVAGPPRLFRPSKKPAKKPNCYDTVIYTDAHNMHGGSTDTFIRTINQPAFRAKKIILNFDAITALSMTVSLNRVTEPRHDVKELIIKLKLRYTWTNNKIVGDMTGPMIKAVLKAFPKLKRFDCHLVVPYTDETEEDDDYSSENPFCLILRYYGLLKAAEEELRKIHAPRTAINFYCRNEYSLKVGDNGCFDFIEAFMMPGLRGDFTLEKRFVPRESRYEPDVTHFKFENIHKRISKKKSFDLRFQGKLVRWHHWSSPWQSPH